MKDVSSTSLIARHFKTDDMKAFFHQNFTAQFRVSHSEVQFTTNTNPTGKATTLNIPPFPPPTHQRGQRRNFLNTTSDQFTFYRRTKFPGLRSRVNSVINLPKLHFLFLSSKLQQARNSCFTPLGQ